MSDFGRLFPTRAIQLVAESAKQQEVYGGPSQQPYRHKETPQSHLAGTASFQSPYYP